MVGTDKDFSSNLCGEGHGLVGRVERRTEIFQLRELQENVELVRVRENPIPHRENL